MNLTRRLTAVAAASTGNIKQERLLGQRKPHPPIKMLILRTCKYFNKLSHDKEHQIWSI